MSLFSEFRANHKNGWANDWACAAEQKALTTLLDRLPDAAATRITSADNELPFFNTGSHSQYCLETIAEQSKQRLALKLKTGSCDCLVIGELDEATAQSPDFWAECDRITSDAAVILICVSRSPFDKRPLLTSTFSTAPWRKLWRVDEKLGYQLWPNPAASRYNNFKARAERWESLGQRWWPWLAKRQIVVCRKNQLPITPLRQQWKKKSLPATMTATAGRAANTAPRQAENSSLFQKVRFD